MDPYLEHPALWPGVHQRLITYIADTLNSVLPSRYMADIGERLYVVQAERDIYPDIVVLEHPFAQTPTEQLEQGAMGIAVAASDPPWVLTVKPQEIREVYIEILSVADQSRVVTVIEVLSPSNKIAGSEGQYLYLTKQREILSSQTHLIEIDLLRQGEHTVAAPQEMLFRRGKWDYLVCLHRSGQEGRYEVWAIMLQQRLPRIHVPLQAGDPDVVLDLQAVFNRCYDEGAYVRRLDYRSEPPIPLEGDDAQWADALLRNRGLHE
jgi:hypothetical protein